MRAILIEPAVRAISEIDVPDFTAGIRRQFGDASLLRVGRLPSGNGLYVLSSESACDAFCLGGSGPHYGQGLILGKRGRFGEHTGARTGFDALMRIVTFYPIATGEHERAPSRG